MLFGHRMMKPPILLAGIAIVLVSITSYAQTEKDISAIRSQVNLINKNAKSYRKLERTVEGISLEGTRATYFISGSGLKKIVAKIYGETFRATAELFYAGEELIFAFQRLEKYDTHIAADPPPKVAKVDETRVYYSGRAAIRVIEGKNILNAATSDFRAAGEAMTDLSEKLKSALDQP